MLKSPKNPHNIEIQKKSFGTDRKGCYTSINKMGLHIFTFLIVNTLNTIVKLLYVLQVSWIKNYLLLKKH